MEACPTTSTSLPYSEPTFTLILTLGGFIILLNVVGSLLDSFINAGLIGQLVLGALLGTPLASIIPIYLESSIQVLGYIGLLLLLCEGGMDARLDILFVPSNFFLSLLVGSTGILLPIGFSMLLLPFGFDYSYLQSFAVGAALSSTSLGTILALLGNVDMNDSKSSEKEKTEVSEVPSAFKEDQRSESPNGGLISTRLGSVLVGAALLDDIVALVLSGVVSNLNPTQLSGIKPWTAARPVVSSILLLLVTFIIGRFIIQPTVRWIVRSGWSSKVKLPMFIRERVTPIATVLWVLTLGIYVTLSHEIGSTMLLGSFSAGALMQYSYSTFLEALSENSIELSQAILDSSPTTAFETIKPVQTKVLVPFFFSSIGFAIPLTELFSRTTVWRGFVFAGICGFAKLIAGFWMMAASWWEVKREEVKKKTKHQPGAEPQNQICSDRTSSAARSWPPAMLLGLSLIARGEIGFIILNIAREAGIIGCGGKGSEAFNVGIWSIVLNTVGGPIAVGVLLRAKGVSKELMEGRWGWERKN